MPRLHHYRAVLSWKGARGVGTRSYDSYGRDYVVSAPGKADLFGSSDPQFRGDASRWNPEELLLAALASCHMLSYLHLCATHAIVVTDYADAAEGTMELDGRGGGRFVGVRLRPRATIVGGDAAVARELHDMAHQNCFIAASVNFPVEHEPTVVEAARETPG